LGKRRLPVAARERQKVSGRENGVSGLNANVSLA